MERQVARLPYPRVEDKDDVISLAPNDVMASTPASQLPKIPSPDDEAFGVHVTEATPKAPREEDSGDDAKHYHRDDDNVGGEAGLTSATEPRDATLCKASCQVLAELQSPFSVEEELVDYEVGDEDLNDNVLEDNDKGHPSSIEVAVEDVEGTSQVQPSKACNFN